MIFMDQQLEQLKQKAQLDNKTTVAISNATQRATALQRAINEYQARNGGEFISFNQKEKSQFQEDLVESFKSNDLVDRKFKALVNGGSAAAGSALIGQEYADKLNIAQVKGGAFRMAGVDLRLNQLGQYTPAEATSSRKSGFVSTIPATNGAGDVAPTHKLHPVNLSWQKAKVVIDQVLANSFQGGMLNLYREYELLLEEKKLLREDELLAEHVTTSANGVVFEAPLTGQAILHRRLNNAYARLSKYGVVEIHAPAIAWNALYNEQDTTGQPINVDFKLNPLPGMGYDFSRIGKVATFGIANCYVNNGINDDYVINDTSGVITAQSGAAGVGTHLGSAFLLRVNKVGSIGRGQAEVDKIQYIGSTSGNGSEAEFFADTDSILCKTLMGASCGNNDLWSVVAI